MNGLDNTLLVISAAFAGVLVAIGGIITFRYAIKRKNRIIFLFSAMWLSYSIFWFLDAAAHFFYSIFLMSLVIIPQLIGVPCIIIFIELVRKERVSFITMTILVILEFSELFATYFIPDNYVIIPGYGVYNTLNVRIFQVLLLLYYVFFYFNWSLQTWKKAPKELRRLTTYLLVGSILFSIVTAAMYILGTFLRTLNAIAFIVNGFGAFLTILAIYKDPKIIYILPFKAYSLIVVDTSSGNTLFKHDWAKISQVQENLFSMVLQAVGNILDEVLRKGEVREIQLDQAVLLIQHVKEYTIASILITSKSSKTLRYGLNKFNEGFIAKFQSELDDLHTVRKFEKAGEIIEHVFDFIPKY
ncbi:MAG: hypothetical protein ACFFKA_18725 [Candidatus Thorarchaeota archaeon]